MARNSRSDWLEMGFTVLAQEGVGGLTIDGLAARLGVTKGSFYHHFDSADDYKQQLLAYWREQGTQRIIDVSEAKQDDPIAIIDHIMAIARSLRDDPEVALRAWALQDPDVRATQTAIDQQRMAYAEKQFAAHTGDDAQARRMAQLLYCIIVASDQIMPPIQGDDFAALYAEFKRLYGLRE